MGFINLALLAFPPTLLMNQVDVVARTPFWDIGFDYPHSSGYGIGSFLDVHQCKNCLAVEIIRGLSVLSVKYGYF